MKKLLFVILALTLSAGLWAQEKITLTAADFTVTKDGVGIDKETAINEINSIATNAKNQIDALVAPKKDIKEPEQQVVKEFKAQIADGLYSTHKIIDAELVVANVGQSKQMFISLINLDQKQFVKNIQDDFTTSQQNAINEVMQAAATAKEKIDGLGVDDNAKEERKEQIDNIVSTAKATINNATNKDMINKAKTQAIADINNVVQTTKDMWVTVRTDGVADNWNTICLERNITDIYGATFWTVSGQDETSFILDEVTEPQAGQGYLIRFTATELKVKYGDQKVTEPATATKDNPIQGTFTQIDFDEQGGNELVGNYVVYNNHLCPVEAWIGMREHRAYVVKDLVPNTEPQYAPSRARAYMPKPDQTPTELKSVDGSQRTIHNGKLLRNGQLIIVKDNKMYNVQGMKL